jgi:hypothetical protein
MPEQEPGSLALSPTSFQSATLSSRACCIHMPAQPGHFLPGPVFERSHEHITLSDVCQRGARWELGRSVMPSRSQERP